MSHIKWCLILGVLAISMPVCAAEIIPGKLQRLKQWTMESHADVDVYEIGIDQSTKYNDHPSCCVRSKSLHPKGFAEFHQAISAELYKGKKLRFSGFFKSQGVAEWSGLWMRIDGNNGVMAFDNMADRPVSGTNNWKKCSIVLAVPKEATEIRLGCMLTGPGTAWINSLNLEVVPDATPVTGKRVDPSLFPKSKLELVPRNLTFED